MIPRKILEMRKRIAEEFDADQMGDGVPATIQVADDAVGPSLSLQDQPLQVEGETLPEDLAGWSDYLSGGGFDAHYDEEQGSIYVFLPATVGDETDIPLDGPIAQFSDFVGGLAWTLQVIDGNSLWTCCVMKEDLEEQEEDEEKPKKSKKKDDEDDTDELPDEQEADASSSEKSNSDATGDAVEYAESFKRLARDYGTTVSEAFRVMFNEYFKK
jgi:hypothetical protein